MDKKVIIIGGGPAGLTAGYLLSKKGILVEVLEADIEYLGGISKTFKYKDFLFDIGGHRFFSKSKEINDLWDELLPDDIIECPRFTRIYYKNKFYAYPIKPLDAFFKLGPIESLLCVLSYLKAKISPTKNPKTFEDWITNNFGHRLFSIFFKTYTEKVWGMSCKEISADWAAQRIKGLSLGTAIFNALFPKKKPKDSKNIIKTLIDRYKYPRKGPGMMWDAAGEKIKEMGGKIHMGCFVHQLTYDAKKKQWNVSYKDKSGTVHTLEGTHVISSAPLREMVHSIKPSLTSISAADKLKYRDFLIVSLIIKEREALPDNWIYIHDPSVKVGRMQNFKAWSPELVPDPSFCCYGMEYFCFEGDGLWSSKDSDLIELAKQEIEKLGLARKSDIVDGCVVRQPKAYPVYDDAYQTHVDVIRKDLEENCPRFYVVGRNGMHKYNNQDHAMMTAMLTVENILADKNQYDVWKVNQDASYHEEGEADGEESNENFRMVPKKAI
ncbi:MAG: NAD(P)/FAD-dependent oxidoreductase [Alphaproteobacteria bacterium]|nr:NAD(P)/FAD-dependent oxidoreductase [Alphaproteobacteria bacterium]